MQQQQRRRRRRQQPRCRVTVWADTWRIEMKCTFPGLRRLPVAVLVITRCHGSRSLMTIMNAVFTRGNRRHNRSARQLFLFFLLLFNIVQLVDRCDFLSTRHATCCKTRNFWLHKHAASRRRLVAVQQVACLDGNKKLSLIGVKGFNRSLRKFSHLCGLLTTTFCIQPPWRNFDLGPN